MKKILNPHLTTLAGKRPEVEAGRWLTADLALLVHLQLHKLHYSGGLLYGGRGLETFSRTMRVKKDEEKNKKTK